ncbi:hypothetical protein ACFQI7_25730 [Paenibacillus allorhizosphaerae]|uniref:Tc toxin complex TcA C-terminal TcB-binding domain-containing protein n=1 Tax=Paenibacillus allorhizosphaerae TaxID=2849866 RepID=A0ABM8VJW5_9BACL|nr:hypothetical protein [Paenibacillus allorhizosphaerae]CAG7645464.1 hypothetical protein PAECIP111802_03523 [Paenibacillus allorhizosphaerae]
MPNLQDLYSETLQQGIWKFIEEQALQEAAKSELKDSQITYTFEHFFHPFVGKLKEKLLQDSVAGMLDPNFLQSLQVDDFEQTYKPVNKFGVSSVKSFPKSIDVRAGGPYANYNWELLFHIPLAIAVHLSKNQRFAEAQSWFHLIFDPTDREPDSKKKYWKFIGFRPENDHTGIYNVINLLSSTDPEHQELKESILDGYKDIMQKPFQPHVIARTRYVAYKYNVVMKYLDNVIAWGDSLFLQDTRESVQEAMMLYVMAANILGKRPQRKPSQGNVPPLTFKQLKDRQGGFDAMGNMAVEMEGKIPFNFGSRNVKGADPDALEALFGTGRAMYFCFPPNDKMLRYWDTVADRLFKIRHCMNMEGVERQLALFDPPIDPGLLVKAAAAGLSLSSVIGGLNQPMGPVRALPLMQKALELCAEVRNFGNALLTAIEKGDGEKLAFLRQEHEVKIHQMAKDVRFLQWKQAEEATVALQRSSKIALEKFRYYNRLIQSGLDANEIEAKGFDQDVTEDNYTGQWIAQVLKNGMPVKVPDYLDTAIKGDGKLGLLVGEYDSLNTYSEWSKGLKLAAAGTAAVTSGLSMIPDIYMGTPFNGVKMTGGAFLAESGKFAMAGINIAEAINDQKAHDAMKKAEYERRANEWVFAARTAALELEHIGRQMIGSAISEQYAKHEYNNTDEQIKSQENIKNELASKFTNEQLYVWMQGELTRLYYEYYRFAFDTARKAEKTMKHELMRPEVDAIDYIKFNYWDGGHKGLLSGEALYLDLKRMETAYHENDKREYELTKHISLRQLDPMKLLELKTTGSCEVVIPEWLYDLDGAGHYMRRIKYVSLSIPSVSGPYTNVNCTLTLLRSSIRTSPLLQDDSYARQGIEDTRFTDYFGAAQSIVTSSGTNDSGMFETNLRDERFLPFEGAGTLSTWKLELPSKFRQFDYNTISDVILHIRYTARQGGGLLRDKAYGHLRDKVREANTSGLVLMLSLKHDFPSEWHLFITPGSTAKFKGTIHRNYFPYFTSGKTINIDEIRLALMDVDEVKSSKADGLDLTQLTTELTDHGKFDMSLDESDVLIREAQSNVFVLIRYSLQ